MKGFLSVKEFSKMSGIEQTTLRYWDDIGLFSPAKRDPENNYRYYTPDQIITVNFITVLSSLNIPLKVIGETESSRNPEKIMRLIEQREKQIDMELRKLRESYSIIHKRWEMIKYGTRVLSGYQAVDGIRLDEGDTAKNAVDVDAGKVAVLDRDASAYILGPRNNWENVTEGFFEPFMNFCGEADNLRVNLNFPIGGIHDDWSRFMGAPGRPDHFFSTDPTGNKQRVAGEYLVGFGYGYYGEFGDLPERMNAFAEENKLILSGPVYAMYLHDEISTKDISNYLSQVCVAVSRK